MSRPGLDPVVGSYEHGINPSDYVTSSVFLDQMSDYQLLKDYYSM